MKENKSIDKVGGFGQRIEAGFSVDSRGRVFFNNEARELLNDAPYVRFTTLDHKDLIEVVPEFNEHDAIISNAFKVGDADGGLRRITHKGFVDYLDLAGKRVPLREVEDSILFDVSEAVDKPKGYNRHLGPTVRIRQHEGMLGINAVAFENLGEPDRVKVIFDTINKRILISSSKANGSNRVYKKTRRIHNSDMKYHAIKSDVYTARMDGDKLIMDYVEA